jgi:hypothetical protein
MPAPTNISAATAIDIGSLPASVSQDVHDAGTTYTVWYKYTAAVGEKIIGLFAFGDFTGYKPETVVYSDAGVTILTATGLGEERPVQFPVTPGNTYWLQFITNSATITPAILSIEMETGPNEAVPVGSIIINDDTENYPLMFLSAVDGDNFNVLNSLNPFPAGEAADILANGVSLWADAWNGELELYDSDFNLITTLPIDISFQTTIRINRGQQLFYVANDVGATIDVLAIDDTGATVNSWTLSSTSIRGLAANLAGTILYYVLGTTSTVVKRWDLTLDVAMSDLAAGVTNYFAADMLVLDDDSIIVLFFNSGLGNFIIKRYDATGAVLNTYTTTDTAFPAFTFPRLAYAIDGTSFWVMFHPDLFPGTGDRYSRFQNWRASDGVVLASVDYLEYELGVSQESPTPTPTARFGNSFSCPFIIAQIGSAPPTGTITVSKVTDPFDGVTSFEFAAGGGLSPDTFSLLSEESRIYNDVPVGDGYSIVETGPGGFLTTYLVSNGSPNTNITVGENENVSVVVLNQIRNPFSGLFQLTPGETHDTLIDGDGNEVDVAIPNPFIITGFLVDK